MGDVGEGKLFRDETTDARERLATGMTEGDEMPFKTPSGDCYHSVEGCYGAMEPCPAGGGLAPCSVCCGRGEGVIVGGVGGAGGGEGSYEEDIPGAYARKYTNSVAGYPWGIFKTADGIIRDRNGSAMSDVGVKACLDEAIRLRDQQARRVRRTVNPTPEDVDYLGQLELQAQCFEAAYSDASQPEYQQKYWHAKPRIEPIEPDTEDESFFERRGHDGVVPKLVPLRDGSGRPFEVSSTRLSDIVDASLVALDEDYHAFGLVGLYSDEIRRRNQGMYEMWKRVPPERRPQIWHLPALIGVDHDCKAMMSYLGIDDLARAERLRKAICAYCNTGYIEAKRSQQRGEPSDTALALEEYVALAPKWDGGMTYRGMGMTREQVDDIMRAAETGGEYQPAQGTLGSWSTNYGFCQYWAESACKGSPPAEARDQAVVFQCLTQSQGTSISFLGGDYEQEVLVSKDARYRVVKAERGESGMLHVLLEEIAP